MRNPKLKFNDYGESNGDNVLQIEYEINANSIENILKPLDQLSTVDATNQWAWFS